MHAVHLSVFRPALAVLLMLGAAPFPAQTPEEPSSRAGVAVTIRNRDGLLDVVGIDRPTDLPDVVANRRGLEKP